LSESQDALPSISAQRKTEPARLTRLVRGDLDWIVMKALEKDRNRRYETATAFAADLHRYLADEPVLACPPSAGYRVRKFARRNRGPVVATGLVAAALVGGIIGTTVGLVRAERARADAVAAREAEAGQRRAAEDERAVARAVNVFWLHDVLRQADSREQADRGFTADPDLSVKEALNRAADRIGDRFRDQPLVEAAARQAIGEAFVGIGEYPRALPQAQRALALRAERLGPDHPLTLASTDGLGTAYLYLDRPADALGLLEAAVKARREALGPAHPDTLDSVVGLAICYRMLGRTAEAVALQEDGLRLAREHLGPDDPVTIRSLNNLASHYRFAGRVPEAIAGQEEALKLQQARRGPRHPATLVTMGLLAMAYEAAGRFSAAVALFEETLTLMKVHLSPDHPHTLTTMSGLAGAYRGAGRLAEAVATQEEALKRWQTRRGPRDPFVLRQVGFLADLQSDVGRHDLAEPLFRRFLEVLEQDWADEWEAFEARSLLGGALLGQKKYAAAEPLLLAGYAGMRKREAKVIEEGAGGKLRAAGRRVVQLYEAWGKPAEAARWRKELGDPPPAK
jgi:tetratricopeptide (TPR) repeat protein